MMKSAAGGKLVLTMGPTPNKNFGSAFADRPPQISPAFAQTATPPARLLPLAATPLPLGEIKPAGWLKRQLQIQASGLGGHLDEFWPDVAQSSWIGGKAEGWERGPYWLDGFIPLAIELDDAALKARAQKWVDYILVHQCDDGWLGPLAGNPDPASRLSQYDIWPRFVLLKALTQWQEATGDPRIVQALTRFLHCADALLDQKPLDEWARARWADFSLSIYWLYDRTREPWLLDLAAKVHAQGLDWSGLAQDFPYREKTTQRALEHYREAAHGKWINDQFNGTHGVNVGMGLKAPAVWSRQSTAKSDAAASLQLLRALDQFHGQPTGIFSCDEHLAGLNPSQGSELCTVVETMFSLETMLQTTPEVALADRLEMIAFNALPGTFSDDMWAHQYDQQANQVICKISDPHIYSDNGAEANLFGLEPNFGCCLANFHQGWPKLASHLWMKSEAGDLMAMAYAPCDVRTQIGGSDVQIHVQTDYPFDSILDITVTASAPAKFPIDLRIPTWAQGATVSVAEGKPKLIAPGTFHRLERRWSGSTSIKLILPMPVRTQPQFNGSVAVYRGPLVFSLNLKPAWNKLRDRAPTADWELSPTLPWNFGLQLNNHAPNLGFAISNQPLSATPFSGDSPPIRLLGLAREIPSWNMVSNAAAPPPISPIESSEPVETVELIPYGCAKLRLTDFPVMRP